MDSFSFTPVRDVSVNSSLFSMPYSLSPLPADLRKGLVAPGLFGLLSVLSTGALLGFLIYRFVAWTNHYKSYIGYNQYVVLIMNLLIADLQQGISFMISFHWIHLDGILAPTRACFTQGFLLNLGDVSSGLFVFFIALHTFYSAVKGRKLPYRTFSLLVVMVWVLSLALTAIGPIMYRDKYFVRAGAWCWASSQYQMDRLALHYIWVFAVQFGTIITYALVLLHLRKTMNIILPVQRSSKTYAKVDRAAKLMVLYPFFYIILTLPLSAGRMWSMAHGGANLPVWYACLAGTLISSCGLVDTLLYALTRRKLLSSSSPDDAPGVTNSPAKDADYGSRTSRSNSGWLKKDGHTSSDSWQLESGLHGGIIKTRSYAVTDAPKSPEINKTEDDIEQHDGLIRSTPSITHQRQRSSMIGDVISSSPPPPMPTTTIIAASRRASSDSTEPFAKSASDPTVSASAKYKSGSKQNGVSVSVASVDGNSFESSGDEEDKDESESHNAADGVGKKSSCRFKMPFQR